MSKQECLYCKSPFTPKRPNHLFCKKSHRDLYAKGSSWENYFKALLKNNSKARKGLDVGYLQYLFRKQSGKCALSDVEFSKIVGKGSVTTNASLDKIVPSKGYVKRNVRLVCSYVNSFRGNLDDETFRWWCEQVVKNGT